MSESTLKDSIESVIAIESKSNTNSQSSSTTRKSVTFDLNTYSSDDEDFYERMSSGRRHSVVSLRNSEDLKMELSYILRRFNLLLFMIYLFLCINWFLIGSQWLLDIELKPKIHCNIPGLKNVTWTPQETNNITRPKNNEYESGCMYYDYNYYLLSLLSYEKAVKIIKTISKPRIKFCEDYTIIKGLPKEASIIKEFDLVCYKKILHVNNIYQQCGYILFAFPAGILADMYGRRPVHIFCTCLLFITSILIPLITNIIVMVLGKAVIGGCLLSINIILNMTYSETCRLRYRMVTFLFAFTWYMVGYLYADAMFHTIQVWRLRELSFMFIFLVCLFGAIMIVPESPRYLIAKQQFRKAWDCLDELGTTENHPEELQNAALCHHVNFQLKILTKSYLRERIVIIVVLNGVGVYFFHIFRNIALRILILDTNVVLKFEYVSIEVAVLLFTSGILRVYKKRKIICFYCVLLSMCIASRMITDSFLTMDLSILAGIVFSEMIIIITYCYMIDVFPTTHRGTAIGFCFSLNSILALLTNICHEYLTLDIEPNFLGALYCGICVTCAAITVISPETGSELPDRKHELSRKLSLEESNRSSSSS